MNSTSTPQNSSEPLYFYWDADNSTDEFYMYMHFAEVVPLEVNQSREFNVCHNGEVFNPNGPISPVNLRATILYSKLPWSGHLKYEISINKTENSNLPPIINAFELYTMKPFLHLETDEREGIYVLISTYHSSSLLLFGASGQCTEWKKIWQGDPCAPQAFVWDGLNCSYNGYESPSITSLNLEGNNFNLLGHFQHNFLKSQKMDCYHLVLKVLATIQILPVSMQREEQCCCSSCSISSCCIICILSYSIGYSMDA